MHEGLIYSTININIKKFHLLLPFLLVASDIPFADSRIIQSVSPDSVKVYRYTIKQPLPVPEGYQQDLIFLFLEWGIR